MTRIQLMLTPEQLRKNELIKNNVMTASAKILYNKVLTADVHILLNGDYQENKPFVIALPHFYNYKPSFAKKYWNYLKCILFPEPKCHYTHDAEIYQKIRGNITLKATIKDAKNLEKLICRTFEGRQKKRTTKIFLGKKPTKTEIANYFDALKQQNCMLVEVDKMEDEIIETDLINLECDLALDDYIKLDVPFKKMLS